MKEYMNGGKVKFLIYLFALTAVALTVFLSNDRALAVENASIYLSSAKNTYAIGEEAVVTLNINVTGGRLGAVEGNISFDPQKLEYQSIEYAKDFDTTLEEKVSNGLIHVVSGKFGGMSNQTAIVYSTHFKALATGSAVFDLATSTVAAADGSKMNVNLQSFNLNIVEADQIDNQGTTQPTTNKTNTTGTNKKNSSLSKIITKPFEYIKEIVSPNPEAGQVMADKVTNARFYLIMIFLIAFIVIDVVLIIRRQRRKE